MCFYIRSTISKNQKVPADVRVPNCNGDVWKRGYGSFTLLHFRVWRMSRCLFVTWTGEKGGVGGWRQAGVERKKKRLMVYVFHKTFPLGRVLGLYIYIPCIAYISKVCIFLSSLGWHLESSFLPPPLSGGRWDSALPNPPRCSCCEANDCPGDKWGLFSFLFLVGNDSRILLEERYVAFSVPAMVAIGKE